MDNLNRKTDVFTPSASSLGLCAGVLATALFFVVLPRLGGDALLRLLLGRDAGQELILGAQDDLRPTFEQLFSNDLLGRAVVFGVWMFIGLCAFIILTTVINVVKGVSEEAMELEYVHQNRSVLLRNDLMTLGFRIMITAAWAGLAIVFIRFVVSFFAVTGYIAWTEGTSSDWLTFGLASVVLFISVHIQIVFARLLAGRIRLWESSS